MDSPCICPLASALVMNQILVIFGFPTASTRIAAKGYVFS
jgi:hypothetical protein